MASTLSGIALVGAILGGSAILTQLLGRAMYLTCRNCQALNARRRSSCRICGRALRAMR